MYLKYCLIVLLVILFTMSIAWFYLKWNGKANKRNNLILLISTVVAIGISLLIPLLAKTLLEATSISMMPAILLAFFICVIMLSLGYGLVLLLLAGISRSGNTSTIFKKKPLTESVSVTNGVMKEDMPVVTLQKPIDISKNQQITVDTAKNTDKIGIEVVSNAVVNQDDKSKEQLAKLLEEVQVYKKQGEFPRAISNYRTMLSMEPAKELATLIIIDCCGILKKQNNPQLIREILESRQGKLLDYEIKREILNNI